MGITWTLTILATAAVAARIYVTFTLLERPGWDMYWAILAWLTAMASQIMQTVAAYYGIGNHIKLLSHPDIVQALKWDWLGRMVGVWASFFGKNVVIALMLRIQGPMHPKKTMLLHFIWVSNFLLTVALVVILCVRCEPTSLWWNKAQPGTCNRIPSSFTEVFGIFQSSWTTASDFALAIYPIFIFWNLSMSWQRKAGLCCIMGAGMVAGIVNVFKTIQVQLAYTESDVTYSLANLLIFTSVEPWLIIICGSLPPLRALFVTVKNKTKISQTTSPNTRKGPFWRSRIQNSNTLEMQTSSAKTWNKGHEESTSQSNESQEDILPLHHHGGKRDTFQDNFDPAREQFGAGIMVRRDYEVDVEPRAL